MQQGIGMHDTLIVDRAARLVRMADRRRRRLKAVECGRGIDLDEFTRPI
jgi:hypothetical protein